VVTLAAYEVEVMVEFKKIGPILSRRASLYNMAR